MGWYKVNVPGYSGEVGGLGLTISPGNTEATWGMGNMKVSMNNVGLYYSGFGGKSKRSEYLEVIYGILIDIVLDKLILCIYLLLQRLVRVGI